jgi:hypothetical protein
VLGSERLTGALLDRLTHHVHILEMNGDSYRLKQSRHKRTSRPDRYPPKIPLTICSTISVFLRPTLYAAFDAGGRPALLGDFTGITGLSDFLRSFIIDVCPWTSQCVPEHLPLGADAKPPGSRARCFDTCSGS